jgi:hypothetical protein
MDVIGHQAIGPDARPGAARRRGEQVAIEREIIVLEEGLGSAVAALGDVVGHAGNHDAGEAGQMSSCPSEGEFRAADDDAKEGGDRRSGIAANSVHLVNCHRIAP